MRNKSGLFQKKLNSTLKVAGKTLYPILSPRQPLSDVENSLLLLKDRQDLDFVSYWLPVIAVSNIELAYVFITQVGKARRLLGYEGLRPWVENSLSIYDREGLYPAANKLVDIEGFNSMYLAELYACSLEEIKPHLDLFIRGLVGRELHIKEGKDIYTDTVFLYLPITIRRYKNKSKNRALYKSMACFLWAQTWYGTFRRNKKGKEETQYRLNSFKHKKLAGELFLFLENIRLMANIERDLPGLYREMSNLSRLTIPHDKTWEVIVDRLSRKDAKVGDTFHALDLLMKLNTSVPNTEYQGVINFEEANQAINKREAGLVKNIQSLADSGIVDEQQISKAIETVQGELSGKGGVSESEPVLDGESSSDINSDLTDMIKDLLQDIETLTVDDLFDEGYQSSSKDVEQPEYKKNTLKTDYYLDEWDFRRQNYRKDWCHLKLRQVEAALTSNFEQETKQKYPSTVLKIRNMFESMRDQPRLLNRQTDGDDIDLDAVVDLYTAKSAGEEFNERLYIRRLNIERSVAVSILVDMSGSTKGWINLAMRESLLLFSEALNTLGDQYEIYGFSGLTRQRCELYEIKNVNDNYYDIIKQRISNIQAQDYTRMGFAVRSVSRSLKNIPAKHKILLLLSDGKPDDYDGYQGEYGIQDTRKAILEAQGASISPFCITIDKQAQTYLPRMFGVGHYTILNDVAALPIKLSEIYRKLST